MTARQDSTAPNGRFDLCIPRTSPTTKLLVTQPSGNSQCTTPPAGYSVPTILIANRDVIQAGGFFSGRSFTTDRQQTFFQMVGAPFDSNKAQVFVHVNGTPHAVSLAAAHAPAQAIMTSTWGAGNLGKDVFFPNVDVGVGHDDANRRWRGDRYRLDSADRGHDHQRLGARALARVTSRASRAFATT